MGINKIDKKQGEKGGAAYQVALIVVCVTAAVLALVYFAGAFFFAGHYYWRTQIDGKDYSFCSKEKVREAILNPAMDYELKIVGREGMEAVFEPEELGMTYAFDDTLDRFNAEASGLQWPVMFWKKSICELPKAVVFDEEALEKKLRTSVFFAEENIHQPVDARIGAYVRQEGYSIIEDYPGTVLDYEKVLESAKEALFSLQETLDLTEGEYYSEADVKADDSALARALETANRYVSARITYLWNGETVVVDGDTISQWIEIDFDEVSLDEEAVREYIESLAKEYDTFGKNRNFTTTKGDTITLKSGSYGWWTNRAGETEELIESIKKGEELEKEPLYYSKGYAEGPAGADIGTSYVEIDLGNQHLYLYIDGKLITESDLVSGNLARGYGTPAGVFGLTYKERNATLTGETYASHVDFWMPFNGNIGMHDASWRSSFGGEIYQNSGSHGCINLPREAAEIIYEHVERGFPVICYY